ncbi:specifically androgen-regulated gene protein isoform 1-T2 [Odontesthes bonariensis]|uniref:specifically androgen-regulated gene protein n=1 Tax=Odontesthes bonariensis TaxID=219752 RepID=UPI003F58CB75
MPKSDTWPGGTGLETMNEMDSAGSCDSVVSVNSGFSDDSLEHLSAEEKACLMFLEETIESLDTEEDSGLSNDEPDQLPYPGSLATKLVDLSVSMSKSKLNGSQRPASKEPIKKKVDTKPMQSYLVPTPLVVASSSLCSVPSTKPITPTDKAVYSKSQLMSINNKPAHKHNQKPAVPRVPLEVNVVIPPSTKPKDYLVRTAEGALPRGPLSYDALVHLRRNASTKKTPLCPKVDHTIHLDKMEEPNIGDLQRSDKSHSEVSRSPPAVAPKPKQIPAYISVTTQNGGSLTLDVSCSVKHPTDPQVVRLEALKKLGLLKDQEQQKEGNISTPNRSARGPPNCNPSRSPSFCSSQIPTEPKNRLLQSSVSFHHHSRHDQQPVSALHHPVQSSGLKSAVLERSASLQNYTNCPEQQNISSAKPIQATSTAQPVSHNASNSVGYTVMVVPGMGADRKEALRKLGLLKD